MDKQARLRDLLQAEGRVVVAYSGGVDSAYLTSVIHEVLAPNYVAITADSPSLARSELDAARRLAAAHGWSHEVVKTEELRHPGYVRNDGDRCYWCKTELFELLSPIADERGARVATGTNLDDLGDYRPGLAAGAERGVITPLVDARMTKDDVRDAARAAGLEVADKPATPCLASRIAPGVEVSRERLERIERAEEALRAMGFEGFRVRDHGDLARLELDPGAIESAAGIRSAISDALEALGWRYVTIDLKGFRSGSMNPIVGTPSVRRGR